MLLALLKFYYLSAYVLLSAQAIFYHLAFSKALEFSPMDLFVSLRKSIDPVIGPKLRFLFLSGILSGIVVLLFPAVHNEPFTMAVFLLSLLLLIADLVIALVKSTRLNRLFTGQYPEGYMAEQWHTLKRQWLQVMLVRGMFNIIGLALLLLLMALKS